MPGNLATQNEMSTLETDLEKMPIRPIFNSFLVFLKLFLSYFLDPCYFLFTSFLIFSNFIFSTVLLGKSFFFKSDFTTDDKCCP